MIYGVGLAVDCMEQKKFAVAERPPKLCKEGDLKPYCDRDGC